MILSLKIACLRFEFLLVVIAYTVVPAEALGRYGERLLLRTIAMEQSRNARKHLKKGERSV